MRLCFLFSSDKRNNIPTNTLPDNVKGKCKEHVHSEINLYNLSENLVDGFYEPFEDSGSDYVPSDDTTHSSSNDSTENVNMPGSIRKYSEATSPQKEENVQKKRTRERKHNVKMHNWVRNKNKKRRMKGEKYHSFKKNKETSKYETTEKDERKLGPPCNCSMSRKSNKLFCNHFSEEERQSIFERFWKQFSWDEKKMYIFGLVDSVPIKCRKTGT